MRACLYPSLPCFPIPPSPPAHSIPSPIPSQSQSHPHPNPLVLPQNIAGVVKDWMLIGLSVWMFKSAVSGLNLFGYFIAFLAVCW